MKFVTYTALDAGPGSGISTARTSSTPDSTETWSPSSRPERRAAPARRSPRRSARPAAPRTLRDFLTFEGHLKNAFAGLGKEIPDEWYTVPGLLQGPARHGDRARGGDPVAALHRASSTTNSNWPP